MAWMPELNEKVAFERGMYGWWRGTVRAVRAARADRYSSSGGVRTVRRGELFVDLTYTRANGSVGKASVRLADVLPVPFTRYNPQ